MSDPRRTDFAALAHQFGAPPQIVLVTCGNTSNAHLRQVLGTAWPTVALMLGAGWPLVEIGNRPRGFVNWRFTKAQALKSSVARHAGHCL